jgi:hypothetical protein
MKILELIKEIKELHPELRVGQIIDNATTIVSTDLDAYYINDIQLKMGLTALLESIKEDEPKRNSHNGAGYYVN